MQKNFGSYPAHFIDGHFHGGDVGSYDPAKLPVVIANNGNILPNRRNFPSTCLSPVGAKAGVCPSIA
jgi:hypothetical protein